MLESVLAFIALALSGCGTEAVIDGVTKKLANEVLSYRASQIAEIRWTPKAEVPTQGGVYAEGKEVVGLPYSSVKEKEKFLGQYVSLYTFMTAVANPKSVLYTENVLLPPYHGTNCSTYYGTVCSMAVNYVLGLPYPYTTHNYKNLDCFSLVKPPAVETLRSGDLLLQDKKHVVMVLDITEKDGVVEKVSILESSGGSGTRIRAYTVPQLMDRWKRDGWEILRYKHLEELSGCTSMSYNDYPYNSRFNSPLCCSLGDRACYREGEAVVLNNLDGREHRFVLKKGADIVSDVTTSDADYCFSSLDPGIYTVDFPNISLTDPSFEVLETAVSAQVVGDDIEVSFSSSNGKPIAVVISNINGAHKAVVALTDLDREVGRKMIVKPSYTGQLYAKVIFEGKYGCAINEPFLIK